MLRNIIKLHRRVGAFLPFKPQSFQPLTIHSHPSYYSSRGQPPKGFEKFRREKGPAPARKPEESSKPNEQKIDVNEDQEDPEEVKKASSRDDKPKIRWEKIPKNKEEKQKEEDTDKEKEREKEETQSKRKEPEEEHIEEEDQKDDKKQKKGENPFNFNFNFKWGNKGSEPNNPMKMRPVFFIAAAVAVIFGQAFYEYYSEKEHITYNEFVTNYLEQDKIVKINIRTVNDGPNTRTIAILKLNNGEEKSLVLGNVNNFLENFEKNQAEKGKSPENYIPIEFEYRADTNKIMDKVINLFYIFVTIAIFYSIYRQLKSGMNTMNRGGGGGGDIFGYGKSQVKIYGLDNKVKVKFKDVAGLDEAKVEITEFVDFLKKPKKFKEIGAKIPRGALLTGPPGTGKTLLAKAAAGEAGVPFLSISGSDFVEMFVGVGASRVRDLFKKAKENAPSIIFIDEIDAVGRKRESKLGGNDERDNTLNQLLVEMDGFGTESNVIVLAATNRKELLDPALTRPGRFDRTIEVTLPDIEGRKQIFMVHLKPLKLDPNKTMEDYAKRLATLTPGFSGADIANLCNEAAILAARKNKKFVSSEEFESASERVIAGLEKKRIVTEEERRTIALHESGHAVVSWFLEGGYPLLKLTIIPRSKGSLGFAQYLPNESSLETREELIDRICSILGGRCSEQFFNGRITTGAYDDLRKAYDIAHAMITKFGMSDKIGFIGFQDDSYSRQHSDDTAEKIDEEIKRIIDECTERTRALIKEHKTHIENLAEALLKKETLDLEAIVSILGERPFEPKSNFKAYLENRKEQKEEEEQQAKEKQQENNEDNKENENQDKDEDHKEEKKEEKAEEKQSSPNA